MKPLLGVLALVAVSIVILGCATSPSQHNKEIARRVWRIVGGRITDEWSAFDQLSILEQLGLMPKEAP